MRSATRWTLLLTLIVAVLVLPDVAHADMLSGTCDASAGYKCGGDGTPLSSVLNGAVMALVVILAIFPQLLGAI